MDAPVWFRIWDVTDTAWGLLGYIAEHHPVIEVSLHEMRLGGLKITAQTFITLEQYGFIERLFKYEGGRYTERFWITKLGQDYLCGHQEQRHPRRSAIPGPK